MASCWFGEGSAFTAGMESELENFAELERVPLAEGAVEAKMGYLLDWRGFYHNGGL